MTSAEIAERLGRFGDATVKERLQHWARLGVIKPEGDRFPGVGRHRHYSEKTFQKIRILNAMTDLGIRLELLEYKQELIDKLRALACILENDEPGVPQ